VWSWLAFSRAIVKILVLMATSESPQGLRHWNTIMKNTWILPTAALAVGAVGGFISGKNTAGDGDGARNGDQQAEVRTRASARPSAGTAENTRRGSRAASVEEIYRTPGNSSRVQALMAYYSGLSADQLQEEADKLDSLPMAERVMASFLLFSRWAEVDPMAAMTHSNSMGFAGAFVRPTILQSWASVDPANAAKYFTDNPGQFAMMGAMGGGRGGMGGQGAASIIASEWARQDPEGAMAWANSLKQGKGDAISSVLAEVAKTNARKATEMFAGMDAADREGAYRAIASQYGAQNFDEAQSWIRTLPADQQDAAYAEALRGLAGSNLSRAISEAAAMKPGSDKDRLVPDLVGILAKSDPAAAAKLAASQESERAQRDSMRALIPAWTAQSPAAALEHIKSQPAGPVYDAAMTQYVMSNSKGNPAELIAQAQTITDDGDRNRALGVTALRWMQTDSEAAKSAIQVMDIPENMKERLLDGRPFWGGGGGGRGRGRD
jgi:hypothetical protein